MKRCPECEFIYEDDQSLCDMDGILLVFDSQKLPKPAKLLGFNWRGRIIPALAALVLSTVLVLVYNVSTRQTAEPTYSPAGVTTSLPQPASATSSPAEERAPEMKPTESPKTAEPKPANTSGGKPADPKKAKETKSTTTQKTANTTQPQKNDSKVESIFKKTGRILKKPFKF